MATLEVNGTTLNYRIDGATDAVPILLSNSLASTLSMWDHQLKPLLDAGYRVIRYDSRGHGASAVPPGPYDIATLARDALGLLDVLDIERSHFCGLSMGGMVGQRLGSHHGQRLLSLTLCDTAAHMASGEIWTERINMVRDGGMAAVADATIDRWFTPEGQRRLAAEVEKVRALVLNTPPEGFCASAEAIKGMDQRESIRSISTPTLVIVGEEDPATPVSEAEFIHQRIPGSRLEVLPGAAHFANVEQAARFNEVLLGFLSRH